jgi:hypothetical protein
MHLLAMHGSANVAAVGDLAHAASVACGSLRYRNADCSVTLRPGLSR